MNVNEITQRLYAIGNAILEKTGEMPWIPTRLEIMDDDCIVKIRRGYGSGPEHHNLGTAKGDTPEAALDAADAIIAALPSPEIAKLRAHMARVADCVDKARADNIADEYVTPLCVTIAAMSDNLLTVQAAE